MPDQHLLDAEGRECERLRVLVDGLRQAMWQCEMALELMAVDRAAGRDDTEHFSDAINAIGDFRQQEKAREEG